MMKKLSYSQVYNLFGYQKSLCFSPILDNLLYAVCPTKEFNEQNYQGFMDCGIAGYMLTKQHPLVRFDLTEAQSIFLSYLGKNKNYQVMLDIESKLYLLELKKHERNALPWYALRRRHRIASDIRKIGRGYVSVSAVIQYLEYRALRQSITSKELYCLFANFVQEKMAAC
jgi:hypothetical protein